MNNKAGLILRLILGGYLVFLGVSVIVQATQTQPSDLIVKVLFGILFIAVGGAYAISQIKKVYCCIKEETEEEEVRESTQPLFVKPQHDEALYRTAPMPAEEISKTMSTVQNKEKEQNTEEIQIKQEAPSQLDLQKEETTTSETEQKDPGNLAIEIMRDENEELSKTAEELEKDYEEK